MAGKVFFIQDAAQSVLAKKMLGWGPWKTCIKINTHTQTPVCGKWKVLSPRDLSANRGLSERMPAWCHACSRPAHPLLIDQSVFPTQHESYQLITIQLQCLDSCCTVCCVCEECEETGPWPNACGGSDEASPAAPCLYCGSVGREHPNHPRMLAVSDKSR